MDFSVYLWIFGFFLDLFQIFSGRHDTSGSMIQLLVPKIMKSKSRIVLDGACDDDYDDL